MTSARALACLVVLAAAGCMKGEVSGPDAGAEDAGSPRDAGLLPDAGTADAGALEDAGTDGGLPENFESAGCDGGAGLPEGKGSLQINDAGRRYVVRLPTGYSKKKAYPLVLALHPNGSNATYWDQTSGNQDIRDEVKTDAILILPEARTGDWRTEVPVDETYFDALLKRAKDRLCLDTRRIFSMGFSGGGSYSGVLGCTRTDIRAIAVGGAVIYFDPQACVGAPAAWITIGMDEAIDARLEYRDFWRTRNACTAVTTPVDPSPCVAYTCPLPERPTTFCTHVGGHEWPTFGSHAAWQFFKQF